MSDQERMMLLNVMGGQAGQLVEAVAAKQKIRAMIALTNLTASLGVLAMEIDALDSPARDS